MPVEVTFADGTVVQMRVPSDILLCDFIRRAHEEAGTSARVSVVVFL